MIRTFLLLGALLVTAVPVLGAEQPVKIVRVPDGGIQPEAAVDSRGRVHLIYFRGDAAHGDVFYVRSDDSGQSFSKPIRVNSQPLSVVAIGAVRGAQLALCRDRPCVAWMGSDRAEPKPAGAAPMLFSRLNDGGDSFEPQRNVITEHFGLDGGGAIAADDKGRVYVAWHAPKHTGGRENDRHVWLVRSDDEGKSFNAETDLTPGSTGACGCCGMRLLATHGGVIALYRSATEMVHRDIYLAEWRPDDRSATATKVGPWTIGACVMSTGSLAAAPDGVSFAAWEQEGKIFAAEVGSEGKTGNSRCVSGEATNCKHPATAVAANGQRLIAWTEGTAWGKGGSLAWQVFDPQGQPVGTARGRSEDLPVWDTPSASCDERRPVPFVLLRALRAWAPRIRAIFRSPPIPRRECVGGRPITVAYELLSQEVPVHRKVAPEHVKPAGDRLAFQVSVVVEVFLAMD